MSEFRRISKTSSFVTGSLESETGSEYLFGFSEADGLMWLERKGLQYSASDKEWGKADAFLRSSLSSEFFDADGAGDEALEIEVQERPTTIRRSSVASDYDMGSPLTPAMVGMGSRSIDDDDLAGRAMQFLSGNINEFAEPDDYEEVMFDDDLQG